MREHLTTSPLCWSQKGLMILPVVSTSSAVVRCRTEEAEALGVTGNVRVEAAFQIHRSICLSEGTVYPQRCLL